MITNKDEQKKLMELFFIKYENGKIPQKIHLHPNDFGELVDRFQQHTTDKVEIEKRGDYIDIYTFTGSIDVRLRSDVAPFSTMVITSLSLESNIDKTYVYFLQWLTKFSLNRGFQRIMIENCHTEEQINFATDHGFLPLYQQTLPEVDFGLNSSFEMYLDETLIKEIR